MTVEFISLLIFFVISVFLLNKEDGYMVALFLVFILGVISAFLILTKTKVDRDVYIETIEYRDMKRQVLDLDRILSREFKATDRDRFIITIVPEGEE